MRPHPHLPVALIAFSGALIALVGAFVGCSTQREQAATHADRSARPRATIAPLQSCETRELRYDGSEVVLVANVDHSLASLTVVASRSDAARKRAVAEIEAQLGTPHPDTRIEQRPWKDGLVELTDPCGRLVTPSPEPT